VSKVITAIQEFLFEKKGQARQHHFLYLRRFYVRHGIMVKTAFFHCPVDECMHSSVVGVFGVAALKGT
jgi:hypothetical protein